MKHLSDLFEKYKKNIKPPQASIEKTALEVIKEVTGFELDSTAITYKPTIRTLSITAPSLVKQEILLKQSELKQKLTTKLGRESAPQVIR